MKALLFGLLIISTSYAYYEEIDLERFNKCNNRCEEESLKNAKKCSDIYQLIKSDEQTRSDALNFCLSLNQNAKRYCNSICYDAYGKNH